MNLMTYLINPNFLFRNLTGIERFAYETCRHLDEILTPQDDVRIVIPCNAKFLPQYKNIQIIQIKKPLKSFPRWDLFEFALWCRKLKAVGINFSNTAPLGKRCGISFIHDIYAKDFPKDFCSFKEKLIRLYCCFNYKNIAKNARTILTVSNFSKAQIIKAYKVAQEKIQVIPNGWEHFNSVTEQIPLITENLTPKSFYFTLGSLQKRKNLNWIVQYAKSHPHETFVISGKAVSGFVSNELDDIQKLSNIRLLGYVTDGQVKWLMKNCKAFIFPSYYEGFGIPPLEALSTGAKIIVGKAASLPEIYKGAAYYIDPYNWDCDLDKLITTQVTPAAPVLNEYTYDKAAQKLYNVLKRDS